jgi:hypothetical protein
MIPLPEVAGRLLVEAHKVFKMKVKAGVRNSGCFLVWWVEQWCFVK